MSRRARKKRCPYNRKICYRDVEAATWGAQRLVRGLMAGGWFVPPLYGYVCPTCRWWHITRDRRHQAPGDRRRTNVRLEAYAPDWYSNLRPKPDTDQFEELQA